MKLYQTKFYKPGDDENAPTGRAFDGSGDAASKRRTALKKADKEADPKTETVEVVAKKEELLQFLNGLFN